MSIPYDQLKDELHRILLRYGFSEERAGRCARIFAESTLDGFHSHGINRFAEFIDRIREGYIVVDAEPERQLALGNLERWDGRLGPGPLNAWQSMDRAITLARQHGMGCVALGNTNHWMRGGTYGWQAAEAGCIGICFTNTKPNMPPWGGRAPRTGNNPLIIAAPGVDGAHLVLDMALSQFAYGKLHDYARRGEALPFPGGLDREGEPTTDPQTILETELALPIGYWKGAGLSVMLDLVATLLSGGQSTADIGKTPVEYGLSQVFLAFDTRQLPGKSPYEAVVQGIIDNLMSAPPVREGGRVYFPGEQTLERRRRHLREGIPVHPNVWETVLKL